ncbi:unnamed protein product [Brugia pahangi]|uniref:Secreted protein n=1 Tax=Brugia pahangi TaxID=6280 RepID=A0A0N4TZJ8_BRUPA|nr:unnamed protein product [Brugia pahangi]
MSIRVLVCQIPYVISIPTDSLGSAISSETTYIPKQNELHGRQRCFYQKRKADVTVSFNISSRTSCVRF